MWQKHLSSYYCCDQMQVREKGFILVSSFIQFIVVERQGRRWLHGDTNVYLGLDTSHLGTTSTGSRWEGKRHWNARPQDTPSIHLVGLLLHSFHSLLRWNLQLEIACGTYLAFRLQQEVAQKKKTTKRNPITFSNLIFVKIP